MRTQLQVGVSRTSVEAGAALRLEDIGFSVDYAAIRTPDLAEPDIEPAGYALPGLRVALIAARLGRTRLIDNLEFTLG
jgi:pantoate--beta-alanine ligase